MSDTIGRGSGARSRIVQACGLLLLFGRAGVVEAASIGLRPLASPVNQGSLVNVIVYGTGFADGADGGDFWLTWSSNLEFVAFTVHNPPWDLSAYDNSEASLSQGVISFVDVFSSAETPGTGGAEFDVATLTLLAANIDPAVVFVGESFVGWSLGGELVPDVSINESLQFDIVPAVVPLPAAGWLLASGLGLLGWAGRARPRSKPEGRPAKACQRERTLQFRLLSTILFAAIHGIIRRSSAPTVSIGCAALAARALVISG